MKHLKRILALLLSLAMILILAMPALAEEDEPGAAVSAVTSQEETESTSFIEEYESFLFSLLFTAVFWALWPVTVPLSLTIPYFGWLVFIAAVILSLSNVVIIFDLLFGWD